MKRSYTNLKELVQFIGQHPMAIGFGKRKWIRVGSLDIYVRLGPRRVQGLLERPVLTLDLATLVNEDPGNGQLSALLPLIECEVSMSSCRVIYVENVLEERFRKYWENHGYRRHTNSEPPSYWKYIAKVGDAKNGVE